MSIIRRSFTFDVQLEKQKVEIKVVKKKGVRGGGGGGGGESNHK